MSHHHVPPSPDDPGSVAPGGGHSGWRMAGMMVLCCIPMIILIALAVAGSR
jgi:hypothetical protein